MCSRSRPARPHSRGPGFPRRGRPPPEHRPPRRCEEVRCQPPAAPTPVVSARRRECTIGRAGDRAGMQPSPMDGDRLVALTVGESRRRSRRAGTGPALVPGERFRWATATGGLKRSSGEDRMARAESTMPSDMGPTTRRGAKTALARAVALEPQRLADRDRVGRRAPAPPSPAQRPRVQGRRRSPPGRGRAGTRPHIRGGARARRPRRRADRRRGRLAPRAAPCRAG